MASDSDGGARPNFVDHRRFKRAPPLGLVQRFAAEDGEGAGSPAAPAGVPPPHRIASYAPAWRRRMRPAPRLEGAAPSMIPFEQVGPCPLFCCFYRRL